MVVLLGPSGAPVDEIQMKPCFMMGNLISRSQAECSSWNGKGAVKSDFPILIRFWRLQESAHISPASWNRTWSKGVEPSGVGKSQSAQASSVVLMMFLLLHRHAAPLKSPATKSTCSPSITARIVRMSFFPNTTFFGVDIANV